MITQPPYRETGRLFCYGPNRLSDIGLIGAFFFTDFFFAFFVIDFFFTIVDLLSLDCISTITWILPRSA